MLTKRCMINYVVIIDGDSLVCELMLKVDARPA